jgi:hypothetical protein
MITSRHIVVYKDGDDDDSEVDGSAHLFASEEIVVYRLELINTQVNRYFHCYQMT